MDDKKKTEIEEKTKEETSKDTDVITVLDESKETKQSQSDDKKDSEKEDSKKEEKADQKVSEKEDNKKEEKADKKDSEKEASKKEEKADKKDSEKENSEKEEKADKKDSEKENSEKEEKADKKDSEKKESLNEKAADKKESDLKDKAESEKTEDKMEESAKKNNAISQSKRLADVKAAEEEKKQNSDTDISVDNNSSIQNPPAKKGKKALLIALGAVAALFLIVYISGYVYFSGHFYQDVAINGVPVSNMDKAQAKQVLDNFYTNYSLTMETIDGKELSIDGKDISMQITLRNEFDNCIHEQQPYIWFVNMFEHHDYVIGADAVWDEAALSALYDSMGILDKKMMTAPKDAYVGVEDGRFAIVKEILGNTIKTSDFKRAVESNLASVQSVLNLMDAGCYKLPSVYEEDESVQAEYEAKSVYSNNPVKLQLDDLILEPGMELYEAVLEKKGDSYDISKDLVKQYVESLAKQYDTMETERTFTTSFNGKKVEVYGSAFGYQLNQDETTNALYKALKAGKPSTVDAVFDSKGYTLQGENDIGKTYVEVNLSEQRVIAYKNGRKIAEGDCVSGKESVGHGTCIGLYAIQDKLSPTVLRGEKVTVTKEVTKKKKGKKVKVQETTTEYEYESPVTFWLQFNGGIGLHDAAGWRSQYGGSIYYYSGSHGCVNLPYDLAKTIYENFEIGDPVVVYFWDNENRK